MPRSKDRTINIGILLYNAPAMATGLWASTVLLPGVDLGGGSFPRQAVALLGATALSGAVWGLFGLVTRLPQILKRMTGLSFEITYTTSVAFPALADAAVSIPATGVQVHVEREVEAPDPVGRTLLRLLRSAFILVVVFPLHFWLTGWLAGAIGLGFHVTGFWSVVGGCLIVNVVYVSLLLVMFRTAS